MTAVDYRDERLLPPPRLPHREVGWWAMVLFCLTEASLFAYLLSSYFYLGVTNTAWPPIGHEKPKLMLPVIMTALLLSSSVALWLAERSRERGHLVRHRVGTAATMLLGVGFLSLQAVEYHDKLQKTSPQASAYDSMFFTITGFHGAHVAMGLLILAWTMTADWRGRLAPTEPLALKNASLYWHFVDGVWLVILTCLYLSPRWYG